LRPSSPAKTGFPSLCRAFSGALSIEPIIGVGPRRSGRGLRRGGRRLTGHPASGRQAAGWSSPTRPPSSPRCITMRIVP
jgi:hypothetical protein